MTHWLAIALGGSIGACLRYSVTLWSQQQWGNDFPYGTLIVNILGSFLLGLLVLVVSQKFSNTLWLRQFLFIGVLGAFTTFSTFSYETMELFQSDQAILALKNMFFNLFGSVLAAAAGLYLGKIVS